MGCILQTFFVLPIRSSASRWPLLAGSVGSLQLEDGCSKVVCNAATGKVKRK